MGDIKERERWQDYMKVVRGPIRYTSADMHPGSSCPPTRSGLPACSSPARSSTPSTHSILRLPKMSSAKRRELEPPGVRLESQRG